MLTSIIFHLHPFPFRSLPINMFGVNVCGLPHYAAVLTPPFAFLPSTSPSIQRRFPLLRMAPTSSHVQLPPLAPCPPYMKIPSLEVAASAKGTLLTIFVQRIAHRTPSKPPSHAPFRPSHAATHRPEFHSPTDATTPTSKRNWRSSPHATTSRRDAHLDAGAAEEVHDNACTTAVALRASGAMPGVLQVDV